MYRIIIVDDEPLILAGIASLINWEDYDCAIIGKTTNGLAARDLICQERPDIVITDIRMPVLNGLEMVEACKEAGCTFAFVVLTNLEEFQLVKKALSLGASDYLVKIDLNEEALVSALNRAKEACDLLVKQKQHQLYDHLLMDEQKNFAESFFRRFLLSGQESPAVPPQLAAYDTAPFLLLFSLLPAHIQYDTEAEPYDHRQISKQIIDILSGISSRFFHTFTMMEYEPDIFLLIASFSGTCDFVFQVTEYCQKVTSALKTYFELSAVYGISRQKDFAHQLKEAMQEALTALEYYYYDSKSPIVFYEGQQFHVGHAKDFNINVFKKELSASILQNDSQQLSLLFDQIICLFREHTPAKEQAVSACINIYTYLYSFFETKDENYRDIFPYTINIADQLNHFNSLNDILSWLQSFCQKLCRLLSDRKSTRSDKLVEQAQQYIQEHYQEKLTLSDIAEQLNISPGHLSNTFRKFTDMTLSDYIARVKIQKAQELIDTHQYLIYQVADMLGYESAYYFSKVFRKVTGISPRDYEQSQGGLF